MSAVLVCGSRGLVVTAQLIADAAAALCPVSSILLSGGALGVDAVVPAAAALLGRGSFVIRPDYRRYGRGAPMVRNEELLALCSHVLAVWDWQSPGTAHVLRRARALGKPVAVYRPVGE